MTKYYSAQNNACYTSDLKEKYITEGGWPVDAKEISNELFDTIVTNRPENKVMKSNEDGYPILVDR